MNRNVSHQQWKQVNVGELLVDYNNELEERNKSFERANQLQNFFESTSQILDEIDMEFEKNVKLDSFEVKILFVAIALQCVRQYILTPFLERVDDKTAAKRVKKNHDEHSNRRHRLYMPSLEEIITNPVPFDTNFGSRDFELGIGGGFSHRAKTLGHDPILGWIFGTMNICTSTMTTWNFESYHIKTGHNICGNIQDKIMMRADTEKVVEYTWNRFLAGTEGRIVVATSLLKEAEHLKSDIGSKVSLPLPLVSVISPTLAKDLADYGLDMANIITVGKQAVVASMINAMIAMYHRMFYDPVKCSSQSLYEVKTRKIIDISGIIASTSNIIIVALSSYMGNKNAKRYIDIGGILVALSRLFSDALFIRRVKNEFVTEAYVERMKEI